MICPNYGHVTQVAILGSFFVWGFICAGTEWTLTAVCTTLPFESALVSDGQQCISSYTFTILNCTDYPVISMFS